MDEINVHSPINSPMPKKLKMSTTQRAVGDPSPDAPGVYSPETSATQHPLATPLEAGPPPWFCEFEIRQRAEFEKALDLKLSDLIQKVSLHEEELKSLAFDNQELKDSHKKLQDRCEKLEAKLDDMENRNRRKNLVVFGMREMKEGEGRKENCTHVISKFLEFVGAAKDDINQIERCHRTPTFRPEKVPSSQSASATSTTPPRRIHMAFATYAAKERVRKAAMAKLKETQSAYDGQRIYVAEDLSLRVLALRKAKKPIVERLKTEKKNPFFIYPARIAFRDAAGKLTFVDK